MEPTPLIVIDRAIVADSFPVRDARNAYFDKFGVAGMPPLDAAAGNPPVLETKLLPAPTAELPGDRADVILVGRLTGTQAYLSGNRQAIYTESRIDVERVMSQTRKHVGNAGALTMIHEGGALVLPSGRAIQHTITGSGDSLVRGERYLFFLVYIPQLQAFGCPKAWLLKNGRAVAVAADDKERVVKGESVYHGMDEARFLSEAASLKASWNPKAPR